MKKNICKFLLVASALTVCTLALTGCNSDDSKNNESKETNANVQITSTSTPIVSATEAISTSTPIVSNYIDKVTHETKYEDDTKHYIVLTAYNETNDVLWTYETKKEYVAQYENIEYLTEVLNTIYINENGTIIALDRQTGEIMWKNEEYKGSETQFVRDSYGYLYLSGSMSPKLMVISPGGKTIKRVVNYDDLNLTCPEKLEIVDDIMLKITYPGNDVDIPVNDIIYVDTRDLKNENNKTQEKETVGEFNHAQIIGFEGVKKFSLNSDGSAFIEFLSNIGVYERFNNEKIIIEENVKSITPVFIGNGGFGSLIMIHLDGSVSILSSLDIQNGYLNVINLENYSNIDYVMEYSSIDGQGILLVDKNGKSHLYLY